MAQTRLTIYQCENIARDMAAATYDPLDLKHTKRGTVLVETVLTEWYGADALAKFRKLPKRFHTPAGTFYIEAGGKSLSIDCEKPLAVPANNRYAIKLPHGPLAEQLLSWVAEKERLRTERQTVRKQIDGALRALKTRERVAKEFPEAVPFLPASEIRSLPALPINDIVRTLKSAGTPPGEVQ